MNSRCLLVPCEVVSLFVRSDTGDNAKKQHFSAKSYFAIPFNLLFHKFILVSHNLTPGFNPVLQMNTGFYGIDNFIHNNSSIFRR